MKFLNAYYKLRRFVPRSAQIGLRRWRARRIRKRCTDYWPILPAAGYAHPEWPGWPDGKDFAFVLTHDVDTPMGYARCHKLADLEKRLGFRSSFNFVPEGYPIDSKLREDLVQHGFEVGVHGLTHDGRVFTSPKRFSAAVPTINRYLKEWGAVGFRSPSMLADMDNIRRLDIAYDATSFDTDPFEPLPASVNTIFPMWYPHSGGRSGFAELPYTLPQDHSLFVMLRERSIDIWKRKLDWIAERGGMALLNTHPDYMSFDAAGGSEDYPAALYEDFLTYVRDRYGDRCWMVLPRDLAHWCANVRDQLRPWRKPLKVCIPAYTFYEGDARIIRYAEALAGRGDHVDVVALRRPGQARKAVVNGVHVFRIQERERNERRALTYLLRILAFFIRSAVFITKRHLHEAYNLMHVHSVPDFEVFAALLPKLRGAAVILDIHDIVPEFFANKFSGRACPVLFKTLLWVERISCAFSDHVIIANDLWKERLAQRSIRPEKLTSILNFVDTEMFYRRRRTRPAGQRVAIYPGGLQWHQGVDVAVRAFALLKDRGVNAMFHIHGEGSERESLQHLIEELDLCDRVFLKAYLPLGEVPEAMANADVGIVPKRADSFGDEAYSTKILEFMSQGLPVVASRTTIDTHYFDDDCVRFFESDDPAALADAITEVLEDSTLRERLSMRGLELASRNTWEAHRPAYLKLVDRLVQAKHKRVRGAG